MTDSGQGQAALFCDHCGQPRGEAGHGGCTAARALEPPRYCQRCARRLVVQVTPSRWSARCSVHGTTVSAGAGA